MKDKDKTEEQLLRHILKEAIDILPLGITIRDIDGKILYTNPAEAVMHGFKVEELVGKESKILGPREKWSSMTIEQLKKSKHELLLQHFCVHVLRRTYA